MRRTGQLRRLWLNTSPRLRVTSLMMWAAAIAGTAAGIVGDQRGWWAGREFLTNLISSLVGALFGVPIAVIVIRRISAAESNRLDRAAAIEFARLTINRLSENLAPLLPDPGAADDLRKRLRGLDADFQAQPEHRPGLTNALAEFADVADALLTTVRTGSGAADAVRDAEATWRFLRLHVAPRLQIYGVAWLARSVNDRIDALFERAERFTRAGTHETKALAEAVRRQVEQDAIVPFDHHSDLRILVEDKVDLLLDGVDCLLELHETAVVLTAQLDVDEAGPYRNT